MLNAVDWYDRSPLFRLIDGYGGEEECMKCLSLLIEAGVDVNCETLSANTPLQWAAMFNKVGCLRLLIEAGADVNKHAYGKEYHRNVEGDAAISRAARYGNYECVDLLIKSGADVNIVGAAGFTPLISCLFGAQDGSDIQGIGNHRQDESCVYIRCVKLLLEAEADVYALAAEGFTALTFAVESGFIECAEVLMKEGNIDVNKRYDDRWRECGTTLLMYAAGNGHMKLLDFLLGKGADVNARNNPGYTALIWAAERGYNEGVERLIDAGADVNKATNSGITALTATINNDHRKHKTLRCTQLVLRAGANITRAVPSYRLKYVSTDMKNLLYAAGLRIDKPFKKHDLSLKNKCRKTIRCHLMSVSPANLFHKVEQLESTLPSLLCSFLLYDLSLDLEYENPRSW